MEAAMLKTLNTVIVSETVCCIRPSTGRECIVDVVPGMDGVPNSLNKMRNWAGGARLQIVPT
jgi:hypothetical protein